MRTPFLIFFSIVVVLIMASAASAKQVTITDNELKTIAGSKYSSGELPLGDGRFVTDQPRKGYIFLCNATPDEAAGGARLEGPWIHKSSWSWNPLSKLAVLGEIIWKEAQFTSLLEEGKRTLEGNGLPINHPTGIFPVQYSDPAYNYDRNPNKITAQKIRDSLPANPVYSEQPFCMGGEAGVMLTGVPLYNGFDAKLRDAGAHEVQDRCNGHPQRNGQYHYHNLSPCIKDISVKTVIGYALDGFPITGPLVATKRYLTTENLDECHGITSEIIEDGQKKVTYHYVMTQDFPYSVSCFRGQPTRLGPSSRVDTPPAPGQKSTAPAGGIQRPQPPAEALTACEGKSDGIFCSFTSPRGDEMKGICRMPPGVNGLACIPISGR